MICTKAMPPTRWTVFVLCAVYCLNTVFHPIASVRGTTTDEGGTLPSTSDRNSSNETVNPSTNSPCPALSDMIPCFEMVQLTVQPVSLDGKVDIQISVKFYAFLRTFSIHLHRATESDSAILLPSTKVVSFASTGSRTRTVEDLGVAVLVGIETDCQKCSRIYGTMYRDELEFALHSPTESYFVEPISKFPRLNRTGKHLAVVYRRSDIQLIASNNSELGDFSGKHAKHSREGYFPRPARSRRHILADPIRTCDLLVVADHTFFDNIGHRSTELVVMEMVNHVATADFLFRMTDFDGDWVGDDIGFAIETIHVFEDATAPGYTMRRVDMGSEDTLLAFTTYNFARFCVAIGFTFRDFAETLGISFRANHKEVLHGICARQYTIFESSRPVAKITMNTVVVTQLSRGKVIPRAILSLVVTHELGHSFGAEHDDDFRNWSCNPFKGRLGNYLMHSSRNTYDFLLAKNDWTFSPCSVLSIRKVLAIRGDVCFRKRPFPVCGNLVLDHGEQCDCGNAYSCSFIDPCCTPPSMSHLEPKEGCVYATENGCQCSPRWDLCCSHSGSVRRSAEAFVCRTATDCTAKSVCDGRSASCPAPRTLPDETECAGGEGQCRGGVCTRSVCTINGLADCSCQWPESAKCKVCCGCVISSDQLGCLPAEWLALSLRPGRSLLQRPVYLLPGTKCDGGRGTCSNDGVCVRLVENTTPKT